MVAIFVAGTALAGSDRAVDGVAVGAATAAGSFAGGAVGFMAGAGIGASMCPADSGGLCMSIVLAVPVAGLGAIVGAPFGAGLGATAVHRDPWRSVAFVGATQGTALAVAIGGFASGDDVGTLVGIGAVIGGFVLPPLAAGIGAATGRERIGVAVVPQVGRDVRGVELVASF